MTFIVNGERWCSLIEAVRRAEESGRIYKNSNGFNADFQLHSLFAVRTPITYAPDVTESDHKYTQYLYSYPFPQLPWNGALYYEWSK